MKHGGPCLTEWNISARINKNMFKESLVEVHRWSAAVKVGILGILGLDYTCETEEI